MVQALKVLIELLGFLPYKLLQGNNNMVTGRRHQLTYINTNPLEHKHDNFPCSVKEFVAMLVTI